MVSLRRHRLSIYGEHSTTTSPEKRFLYRNTRHTALALITLCLPPCSDSARKIEPLGITRRRHSTLAELSPSGQTGRKDIAWTVARRLPPDSSGESNKEKSVGAPA